MRAPTPGSGLSAVVGTTGWFGKLDELKKILRDAKIGYLYGSNFSIGAHLFFALAAAATELANPCPEYDIMGWEVHHKRKKDSPSGTALTLARIVTGKERAQDEGRHGTAGPGARTG